MGENASAPFDFKANYLNFLNHKPTTYVPNHFTGTKGMGSGALVGPAIEKGNPFGDRYDGFGIKWEYPASGAGAPVPDVTCIVLDDITEWREKVKIPNPAEYDWKADYEAECKMIGEPKRDQELVDFGFGNGVFERLAALMGFEGALMAIVEDPEEVYALLEAITDYKVASLDYIIDAYHPDTITYYDDVATERDLFISPECFRQLIKPHHKRFADECKKRGVIPIYHCCGYAEKIVEDMIDCGWAVWQNIQPQNDICGMIEKYGDRFGFIGGFDSQGPAAREDAAPEVIEAEVRRCIDEYGKYHKAYCFFGFRYVNSPDPSAFLAAMGHIAKTAIEYGFQVLAEGR